MVTLMTCWVPSIDVTVKVSISVPPTLSAWTVALLVVDREGPVAVRRHGEGAIAIGAGAGGYGGEGGIVVDVDRRERAGCGRARSAVVRAARLSSRRR